MATAFSKIMAKRIRQARKLKGWSQSELAANADLHPDTISRYETGDFFIPDDALCKISDAFNLHPAYFFNEDSVEVGAIRFHKKGKLTKKEQEQIIEIIKEKSERLSRAIMVFDEQPIPVFNKQKRKITSNEEAFSFAEKISNSWGITPKTNLVKIIESKGILFFEVSGVTGKFNGLTTSINKFPAIAINSKNPQQQRTAISHLLAHLFGIESEDLCNSFAKGIPAKDEDSDEIERPTLLETLVWRAWEEEIINHKTAAKFLGISESDFQDMVEDSIE